MLDAKREAQWERIEALLQTLEGQAAEIEVLARRLHEVATARDAETSRTPFTLLQGGRADA